MAAGEGVLLACDEGREQRLVAGDHAVGGTFIPGDGDVTLVHAHEPSPRSNIEPEGAAHQMQYRLVTAHG